MPPNLWDHALQGLSYADRTLLNSKPQGKVDVLQEVLEAAKAKREEFERTRWYIPMRHGRRLILRDVFAKMVIWIEKFREVGNNAVQYEPNHAALPWVEIRFILQASAQLLSLQRVLLRE